ncbi:MAG: FmdB family zinc ribbon protein [Solirubrobacteraceae bacterium]
MPIYEYKCDQGHIFEVMRRMTDEPLSACLTCAAPVEQVYHPIAIHFKGKGFYNTDYGTKKRSREMQDAKSSEGKSAEGAKADGTSSETKSTEPKSTEAKSPEAKSSGDSKPAETKAPAPAPKKSSD